MMKTFIISIVVLICGLYCSAELTSQTSTEDSKSNSSVNTLSVKNDEIIEPYSYFGGFLHYNMNIHSANFKTLPGYFSCCPTFESGFGHGFSFGGLFEMPIEDKFYFGIRLAYSMMNASLTRDEVIGNALNAGIIPNVDRINVEYRIDSKLSALSIEPQVFYNFYDGFTASIGLKAGLMINKTFSQKEEILSPDYVVFLSNNQTQRSVYTNQDIPDAKTIMSFAVLGLAYNYKFPSGLLIVPEVRYELPLYSLSSVSWSPSALNIGLAAKMPLRPSAKPTYDSLYISRDTSVILAKGIADSKITMKDRTQSTELIEYDEYYLNRTEIVENYLKEMPQLPNQPIAKIALKGLDLEGNYVEFPELLIEELETEETFPLLPQIFFPNNSADLSKTNLNLLTPEQTKNFSEANLKWDALSIYKEILNIFAKRVLDNPKSTFTITGCNNDLGDEAGNINLSTARAEAVEKYFKDVWGIQARRIIMEIRNLPAKPANNLRPQGLEENRRVEISSNKAELLNPIRLSDIQRTSNPPIVRIIPEVQTEDKVDKWDIDISQSGTSIRNYQGAGIPDSIDWIVEVNPVPLLDNPVLAKLSVKDSYGQIDTDEENIKIQQKTIKKKKIEKLGDKHIERFSLILFDYDKSDITDMQKTIIENIKSKIKPNSNVIITGYTDNTGDRNHNIKLAMDRARKVELMLDIKKPQSQVIAAGSRNEPINNNSPEGRSYSRTVKVIIETPIE